MQKGDMPLSHTEPESQALSTLNPTENGALSAVSASVGEFCQSHGLTEKLALAMDLAKHWFNSDEASCELTQDFETDDRWLVVRVNFHGSVEDALAAKKNYTARWVAAVPPPQRRLIRLSYNIVD